MIDEFMYEVECDVEHDLNEILLKGEVFITFNKLDGSVREMRATKCKDLYSLPPSKHPRDVTDRGQQVGLIVLWDLDAQAYRSFHIKHLISFYTKD